MSYRTSRSFERVNWTLVIEFEAYLLDYIEKLEKQIAELEAKLESVDLRATYDDE